MLDIITTILKIIQRRSNKMLDAVLKVAVSIQYVKNDSTYTGAVRS
jgi:hypothetical protein